MSTSEVWAVIHYDLIKLSTYKVEDCLQLTIPLQRTHRKWSIKWSSSFNSSLMQLEYDKLMKKLTKLITSLLSLWQGEWIAVSLLLSLRKQNVFKD